MEWLELSFSVPLETLDATIAALSEVVPGGCSIEEPIVPLGPEEGVRWEPWRPAIVRTYLPVDSALAARRDAVLAALASLSTAPAQRYVRDEDWAHAWKEFFHVQRIGTRLVVRPTWRTYVPLPGDVVIDLDPGMAFGTGQHETTQMCLEALDERPPRGLRVLDLGCGSGILAIAAAKLGATSVVALDIDAVAVETARENAARNDVLDRLTIARGSLGADWPFATPPDRAFDLVLANIHARAIAELAPAIATALNSPGATLIGSGIVAERLDATRAALAEAGLTVCEVRARGDWRTLIAAAGGNDGETSHAPLLPA